MAITTINTVLREIIVKLQDEHFRFQSEDIDLKVIFETLHVWLEDMRGDPAAVSYTHLTLPTRDDV